MQRWSLNCFIHVLCWLHASITTPQDKNYTNRSYVVLMASTHRRVACVEPSTVTETCWCCKEQIHSCKSCEDEDPYVPCSLEAGIPICKPCSRRMDYHVDIWQADGDYGREIAASATANIIQMERRHKKECENLRARVTFLEAKLQTVKSESKDCDAEKD